MLEAMESSVNGGFSTHLTSCGDSSEEELTVLPRHTKVVVTGNNRTKSVLVGLQGVVKKPVGLGGWHWLACCVEYIILESDNLSSLFPNAHPNLGGFVLNTHYLFAIMTTLAVLPTVWLRNLSVLSYISAGGVIASVLVVLCLFWVGLVDKVGFEAKGTTTLNLSTLPVAIGLYGYCYSGHAVFPNIYTSMEKPSQYPMVLLTRKSEAEGLHDLHKNSIALVGLSGISIDRSNAKGGLLLVVKCCFGICTVLYAGVTVMGYLMFGELTQSQCALNMPQDLVASEIAVWTTVFNPFTKFLLLQTLILPCVCFISILGGKITLFQ